MNATRSGVTPFVAKAVAMTAECRALPTNLESPHGPADSFLATIKNHKGILRHRRLMINDIAGPCAITTQVIRSIDHHEVIRFFRHVRVKNCRALGCHFFADAGCSHIYQQSQVWNKCVLVILQPLWVFLERKKLRVIAGVLIHVLPKGSTDDVCAGTRPQLKQAAWFLAADVLVQCNCVGQVNCSRCRGIKVGKNGD